jgi:hypothetical protein
MTCGTRGLSVQDQLPTVSPTCPACHSEDTVLRYRENATPAPGLKPDPSAGGQYRCRACGHDWLAPDTQ